MTQRQRAIELCEIINTGLIESFGTITSDKVNRKRRQDAIVALDELRGILASDFCSDSVRELVKKMYRLRSFPALKRPSRTDMFTDSENELLRKIVEE